ncbi:MULTISPECIES: FkbM family methyltransferase [Burkholderia]|uniref:FkbM family methyltransferase n=1 Tax=Burkholderia TaxID=32008 RepID=UPI0015D4860B|nr:MULTISPECIES: FkbM family methyltransferase [Burkholderia]MDF3092561.1 FkbM family methyltransferase [Burkholderia semiarida]MDF3108094.1 FkbM family methyltransferase [Burkholderia semiarida]
MKKNLRLGADVGVAFASTTKRDARAHQHEATATGNAPPASAHPGESDAIASTHPTHTSIRQQVKKLLRPLAQITYRLLKPAIRPIALRARRYLMAELQQDFRQEIQNSLSANLTKLQEIRHQLLQDAFASQSAIHHAQSAIHQELQKATAHMVQELQKAQASIQGDVLTTRQALTHEIRQATSTTAQEFRDTQVPLRQEIVAAHQKALESHSLTHLETQQAVSETTQRLDEWFANINPKLDRIEIYSHATARRVAVNCGNGAVLVRTEAGFALCAENDHALLASLLETGELERGTRLLIEKLVEPGNCFIDVGANIGLHTLAAARSMQGQGKIIAFEPFGPTKALLERSVWMNGFASLVEIHQAAVSNETGHHKLFLGATSGHHSLFPLDERTSTDTEPVEVSVVKIDDIVPATQKVDLLKIDAEGAELQVIESAAGLIERNTELAIIVEFGPAHLKRTGIAPGDWLNAFAAHGLQYRAINSVSGVLEHWTIENLLACDSINLLFSRKNSGVWERLDA